MQDGRGGRKRGIALAMTKNQIVSLMNLIHSQETADFGDPHNPFRKGRPNANRDTRADENDLSPADQLFRLASGTFFGLPNPLAFSGDALWVSTRFRIEPAGTGIDVREPLPTSRANGNGVRIQHCPSRYLSTVDGGRFSTRIRRCGDGKAARIPLRPHGIACPGRLALS